ncbi:hypothetical protein GGR52DRAFT_526196 [Hypoxylon sp. FL1284]|nr:hypothetical protein GGR52DRAFT_526196 [Hypoxylon sp. FL1284]
MMNPYMVQTYPSSYWSPYRVPTSILHPAYYCLVQQYEAIMPNISIDGQEELICECGEPARYLYVAPLNKPTGQPIDGSGIKLATCVKSKCGFDVILDGDEQRFLSQDRVQSMTERLWSNPTQHGEFHRVINHGDHSHIGSKTFSKLHHDTYSMLENLSSSHADNFAGIDFTNLQYRSANFNIFTPAGFNIVHDHSSYLPPGLGVRSEYPQATSGGYIVWLVVIAGILLNFRRGPKEAWI